MLYTNPEYTKAETDTIFVVVLTMDTEQWILCHENKRVFLTNLTEMKDTGTKKQIDTYFDKYAIFFVDRETAHKKAVEYVLYLKEKNGMDKIDIDVVRVGIKGDGRLGVGHGLPDNI